MHSLGLGIVHSLTRMGSSLTRDKRSVKRYSTRQSGILRRPQSTATLTNFFKFSPVLLRLRLLPGWVLLSLAANGLLVAMLLILLVRHANMTGTSPVAVASSGLDSGANSGANSTAQANLAVLPALENESGQRHQLTYQQWQELLAKEAEVAAEEQPDRLTILAGDSISLWFPANLLPGKRNWLNQGISGETSGGLLKRLNTLDETKPETIFVMIGINDLLRGTADETILDNQQEIVQYLQSMHPQAQVVVQSILPHASEEKATWEGRARFSSLPNSRIQKLNSQLEDIAQEAGVYFLDLYPVFADEQGNLRMDLSTDGLHLNPEGYKTWSIALQVYSREVLEPELAISE